MGVFAEPIEISNTSGGDFFKCEAMVDTGSLYTQIPGAILRDLHVMPVDYQDFTLADDSVTNLPIGEARIRIQGRIRTCMVVFGLGTSCLLGATALENLALMVDPLNEELIRMTPRL